MPISNIIVNVVDVSRSVDFYRTFLKAETVGEVSSEHAVLDLVTATIELVRVDPDAPSSTWVPDDLQRGFRHIGFKVEQVDPLVERLKAAGVAFHLEPIEAEGGVRITFFRDPDGTMLEFVQRDLQYTRVLDQPAVAAERAQGTPSRPRFDHVAMTVSDPDKTVARYAPLGFVPIGSIAQPKDPRGFNILYLKSGNTVLEVFGYGSPTLHRDAQLDSAGYVAAVLHGAVEPAGAALAEVGRWAGHTVLVDEDGFTTIVAG